LALAIPPPKEAKAVSEKVLIPYAIKTYNC
jgi:hypothetical protein